MGGGNNFLFVLYCKLMCASDATTNSDLLTTVDIVILQGTREYIICDKYGLTYSENSNNDQFLSIFLHSLIVVNLLGKTLNLIVWTLRMEFNFSQSISFDFITIADCLVRSLYQSPTLAML